MVLVCELIDVLTCLALKELNSVGVLGSYRLELRLCVCVRARVRARVRAYV